MVFFINKTLKIVTLKILMPSTTIFWIRQIQTWNGYLVTCPNLDWPEVFSTAMSIKPKNTLFINWYILLRLMNSKCQNVNTYWFLPKCWSLIQLAKHRKKSTGVNHLKQDMYDLVYPPQNKGTYHYVILEIHYWSLKWV